MSQAPRDQNHVPTALGVSSSDGTTTLPFEIDSATGRLLTDVAGSAPVDAAYLVATANATLTNEVNLGALSTGFIFGTVAGGTSTISSVGSSGSGNVVRVTGATLVTPTLGVASATSINKVTITEPATGATLTLADGSTLVTSGANSITLTSTGATNVTLPTTGTLATLAGAETLSNKTLTAPKFASGGFIADANGNEEIIFITTASAVNEVTITNAATGTTGPLIAASGETNVDLRVGGKGSGKVAMQSSVNFGAFTAYFTETNNGNSGSADTIDWTLSNKQRSTLTDNCTFTFTAPPGPCNLVLKLIQDGTGSRTVTWPAAVHWPSGNAPTLTTTANRVDVITFYWDGTTYFGSSSLNYVA